NCAAIPETLLESELFGYEKGAFTGATQRKEGKWAAANGGTLFLDEISEMPLSLQAKILRVLQEREVTPLGSNRKISLDVRIV
ncbi:sigma 54-interacting transcriptional regulator, partial [Acinetobacter baumannii]|uniref:sigma 54-interacting transcriptional regulator n=1 Tax=Acinetobacter baumannii TaxID=470 RepID=UPI000AA5EC73